MKQRGVLMVAIGLFVAGAAQAQAQTGPQLLGSIADYFSANDYPPAAMRAGAQGRTVAQLGINKQGLVESCTIEETSGSADLDAQTCRMGHRMRFEPARDRKKRAIASTYRLPMRWVLPSMSVPPAPVPAAFAPTGD